MVYILDPFGAADALYNLCACFWGLLNAFDKSDDVPNGDKRMAPVLQVVPIRMVASFSEPTFISANATAKFARMVYDRCPGTNYLCNPDLRIFSPASVVLADTTPKIVHFKLAAEPPSDLFHEQSCMHVSYCQSLDDQWITAVWTDDTGTYQHESFYSMLGPTTIKDIAQEIWDSTCAYIQDRKTKWLVCLAKVGPLEQPEYDVWRDIISTAKQTTLEISVAMISLNTSPIIEVFPAPPAILSNKPLTQPGSTITPVATPQSQVLSPAQTTGISAATPATPGGPATTEVLDADPSARLVDLTDESWGVVLSRSLSVAHSIIDYNPSLSSGYLVKRTSASELDPPVVMEVNIMDLLAVNAEKKDRNEVAESAVDKKIQARQILRELLVAYRGLGLLARLRGIEKVTSCRPWHVAVAERAADALMRAMPVPASFPM